MANSNRRIKKADFLTEVLSVKKTLKENNDPRLETMCLLTESRSDEDYINDLKKMWDRVSVYYGGFGAGNEHLWVYGLLNIIHKNKRLAEHYYISIEDRKNLIERVNAHTKELITIHCCFISSLFR